CNAPGECDAGQVADCADDDCHSESWIGDGYCDGTAQQYGADLCCFDLDGGDCSEEECAPGRTNARQLPVKTKIAEVESRHGAPYVSITEDYSPETRNDIYVLTFSCDACLSGAPFENAWQADPNFGEFTVYGFDAGSTVSVTAQSCTTAGACSEVVGPVTVVAGDLTSSDCVEGGGDPCDGQAAGDANGDGTVNVLDVVGIVNHILAGGNGLEGCNLDVADFNGDETVNVLDVVAIVNLILAGGGRGADATDATMNTTENGVNISADGYIGGVQMTLSHDADFSIELTNDAYIAEYKTDGNKTTLIVINPENEVIFTSTGDFKVEEVLVTNSEEFITVTEANVEFSLSNAYPNPFNPTTTIELNLSEASYASVKVFNLKGETVGVLMDGMVDASTYTMTWDASNLSSGVYMIRAEANGQIATQKVMLVK
ncbi:T9SS type A sorting domain-containing protein, partial [bacterium]|nr:T9SS type A sorting domain-containing protein [bacterium]